MATIFRLGSLRIGTDGPNTATTGGSQTVASSAIPVNHSSSVTVSARTTVGASIVVGVLELGAFALDLDNLVRETSDIDIQSHPPPSRPALHRQREQ
jgi:hypothetical protein